MNRNFLVNLITWFFILLFIYTSVAKLAELHAFKDQMAASPLLGGLAGFISWALPLTEIALAVALFIPAWHRKGLYASLALMVLFTIYLGGILIIDEHLNCSCGGIIEDLSPRQHLLFNGAAIILAVLAIVADRRQQVSRRFRWQSTAVTLLLLGSIGVIILTAATAPAKLKTGLEGRPLPVFSLLLPDSITHLNTSDIPIGKPFIMVGFSPYCVHCQAEMRDIIKNISRFGDTTIYFVTSFPYSDMKKFYDVFRLKRFPNIVVAVDSKDAFLKYFKSNSVPYAAVYDAKKRLKEVVPGQVGADLLSKSLND
jgi:thiol-disulfide isomerase/thioredoxin